MARFPANEAGGDTLPERAMRKAKSRALIPQPPEEMKGETRPRTRTVNRSKVARPSLPSTEAGVPEDGTPSAEMDRSQSISAALLKGAAMVPNFGGAGVLRGLLGGASVGMDIDAALAGYRNRKQAETAANSLRRKSEPAPQPETPLNVPSAVVESALNGGKSRTAGRARRKGWEEIGPK